MWYCPIVISTVTVSCSFVAMYMIHVFVYFSSTNGCYIVCLCVCYGQGYYY